MRIQTTRTLPSPGRWRSGPHPDVKSSLSSLRTAPPDRTPPSMLPTTSQLSASIREQEQIAANAILGIKETIFLHQPDGELEPTVTLRKEVTKLIRRYKPDVVVTGDPQAVFYGNGYINHPDHRAAAQIALYAAFPSAGSRLLFADLLDEGYEPHDVKRLYIHGAEKPDTWVDITDTINTKITALKKHVSQLDTHEVDDWMRKWAEEEGQEKGLKYAESYKVMILEEQDEKPEN